jgi:hypothetical protein
MKTFIEAAGIEYGKAFFSLLDHSYRNLIIGLPFHHMKVQDELMLVSQDAHFDAQLNRHTYFAFTDPFCSSSRVTLAASLVKVVLILFR